MSSYQPMKLAPINNHNFSMTASPYQTMTASPYEGENSYVKSLLDPWNAQITQIPDEDMTPHVLKRTLSNLEYKAPSDNMIVLWNPSSSWSTILIGNRVTHPRNLSPSIGWDSIVVPDEVLAANYNAARLVSAGINLKSNTIPSGTFALSGNINSTVFHDAPDYRRLDPYKLSSYNTIEALQSVGIMEGITGIYWPESQQPFRVPYTNSTITHGSGYDFTFTYDLTAGNTPCITPNVTATTTLMDTFIASNDYLPGFLRGKIMYELDFNIGFSNTTTLDISHDVKIVLAFFYINSTGVAIAAMQRAITPISGDQNLTAKITASGSFYSDFPLSHVTLTCVNKATNVLQLWHSAGTSVYDAGTTRCTFRMYVPDIYERGQSYPIYMATVNQLTTNQVISINSTSNFEVVPNVNLSRNVTASARDMANSALDMTSAKNFINMHPEGKYWYTGTQYGRVLQNAAYYSSRGYLMNASFWSDAWDTIKSVGRPIVNSVVSAFNPALAPFASGAMNTLGFASPIRSNNTYNASTWNNNGYYPLIKDTGNIYTIETKENKNDALTITSSNRDQNSIIFNTVTTTKPSNDDSDNKDIIIQPNSTVTLTPTTLYNKEGAPMVMTTIIKSYNASSLNNSLNASVHVMNDDNNYAIDTNNESMGYNHQPIPTEYLKTLVQENYHSATTEPHKSATLLHLVRNAEKPAQRTVFAYTRLNYNNKVFLTRNTFSNSLKLINLFLNNNVVIPNPALLTLEKLIFNTKPPKSLLDISKRKEFAELKYSPVEVGCVNKDHVVFFKEYANGIDREVLFQSYGVVYLLNHTPNNEGDLQTNIYTCNHCSRKNIQHKLISLLTHFFERLFSHDIKGEEYTIEEAAMYKLIQDWTVCDVSNLQPAHEKVKTPHPNSKKEFKRELPILTRCSTLNNPRHAQGYPLHPTALCLPREATSLTSLTNNEISIRLLSEPRQYINNNTGNGFIHNLPSNSNNNVLSVSQPDVTLVPESFSINPADIEASNIIIQIGHPSTKKSHRNYKASALMEDPFADDDFEEKGITLNNSIIKPVVRQFMLSSVLDVLKKSATGPAIIMATATTMPPAIVHTFPMVSPDNESLAKGYVVMTDLPVNTYSNLDPVQYVEITNPFRHFVSTKYSKDFQTQVSMAIIAFPRLMGKYFTLLPTVDVDGINGRSFGGAIVACMIGCSSHFGISAEIKSANLKTGVEFAPVGDIVHKVRMWKDKRPLLVCPPPELASQIGSIQDIIRLTADADSKTYSFFHSNEIALFTLIRRTAAVKAQYSSLSPDDLRSRIIASARNEQQKNDLLAALNIANSLPEAKKQAKLENISRTIASNEISTKVKGPNEAQVAVDITVDVPGHGHVNFSSPEALAELDVKEILDFGISGYFVPNPTQVEAIKSKSREALVKGLHNSYNSTGRVPVGFARLMATLAQKYYEKPKGKNKPKSKSAANKLGGDNLFDLDY